MAAIDFPARSAADQRGARKRFTTDCQRRRECALCASAREARLAPGLVHLLLGAGAY